MSAERVYLAGESNPSDTDACKGLRMRSFTALIIAAAAVLVVAVAVFVRMEPVSEAPPRAPATPSRTPLTRSARVEERLGKLRSEYDHRQTAERPAAPEVRAKALPARPRTGVKELQPSAEGELRDPEEREEFERLKKTLLTDPDPDERIGAVLMLTGVEDNLVIQALTEAMNDPDAEVRLAVVEALGDYSDDLSPDVLVPAVEDSDPEVRFEAVGVLGDMDDPHALELVRTALNDPDEDVRALAQGIIEFAED